MSTAAAVSRPVDGSPGVGGYVLAVAVSVVVLALEVSLMESDPASFLGVMLMVSIYGGVLCLPFAIPGVVLVHYACRHVEHQSVHVAAAGAAGLLTGFLVQGASLESGWLPLVIGVATVVGRASVIPFARARRRS